MWFKDGGLALPSLKIHRILQLWNWFRIEKSNKGAVDACSYSCD